MHLVTPSAHLIAWTHVDREAEAEMLAALGAPENWTTDAEDGERLTEVMGRLCYKSFGTEMNANITRTREGNENYIGNILSTQHGSVIEHASATVGFIDVSPVVTHELVRHRVGTAFSQVSFRFVRLEEIGAYFPKAFQEDFLIEMFSGLRDANSEPYNAAVVGNMAYDAAYELRDIFRRAVGDLEQLQLRMAKIGRLDDVANFNLKKRFTSSMRRLAPYGLATSIGVTANHRAWRFMIQQRTSRHAEEEIRLVFGQVAEKLALKLPNLYQDMDRAMVDGFDEYTFANHKV